MVVKDSSMAHVKSLGLGREVNFYKEIPLNIRISKCYYAFYDHEKGRKILFLEDLSSYVECGIFFGEGNPHNIGRDLNALTAGIKMTAEELTSRTFEMAAEMHSAYW
jgi:hypothetical protein